MSNLMTMQVILLFAKPWPKLCSYLDLVYYIHPSYFQFRHCCASAAYHGLTSIIGEVTKLERFCTLPKLNYFSFLLEVV